MGLSIFDQGESEPPDDGGPPDHGGPSRRRRRGIVLLLIGVLAVVLVVPAVLIGGYARSVEHNLNDNLRRQPSSLPTVPDSERPSRPTTGPAADAVNFLLIGSDNRGDGNGGRSDALMVLHLDADRQHAYLISIPRDLYVDIPHYGKHKVNAAYAYGGSALAVQAVENLLDVRIDHVAQIDMPGFIRLTDELGGVTVHNRYYSHTGAYVFPVGTLTLSGDRALAYVRERKQLPRGDLDRTQRQRVVVQAIIAKALSRRVITHPAQLNAVVRIGAQSMTVDEQLTGAEIRKLALSLRMGPNDVGLVEVPTRGSAMIAGESVLLGDTNGIHALAAHLRADTMGSYRP